MGMTRLELCGDIALLGFKNRCVGFQSQSVLFPPQAEAGWGSRRTKNFYFLHCFLLKHLGYQTSLETGRQELCLYNTLCDNWKWANGVGVWGDWGSSHLMSRRTQALIFIPQREKKTNRYPSWTLVILTLISIHLASSHPYFVHHVGMSYYHGTEGLGEKWMPWPNYQCFPSRASINCMETHTRLSRWLYPASASGGDWNSQKNFRLWVRQDYLFIFLGILLTREIGSHFF